MDTYDPGAGASGEQYSAEENYMETDYETDEDAESDDENIQSDDDGEEEDVIMEIKPMRDHVQNATNILSSNLAVSYENALTLNRAMQQELNNVRDRLEDLLHKMQQKIEANVQILTELRDIKDSAPLYHKCGAPFFKNLKGASPPANEDYVERSTKKGEVFLMDLKALRQRYWLVADKCNLVNAVKSQVIDYLNAQAKKLDPKATNIKKCGKLSSSTLASLLRDAGDDFKIDWEQISKFDLSGRHTAKSCCAMWHGYMKPDLNRGEWSKEESGQLMTIAEMFNFQNWSLISQQMPGRSESQCFVQFQTTVNRNLPTTRKWSAYEDATLVKAVKNHKIGSVIDWNSIRGYFINRSRKSLSQRYRVVLNPGIKKRGFTREEDCVLLAAVEEYGENFACIPMTLFPNRTRKQIKSRYLNTVKYAKIQRSWSMADDQKLLDFVKENGLGKWAEIAKMLVVHSRTSCRTRYNVIQRFLKKNPNATVAEFPRKKKGLLTDVNQDNWVEKIFELKTQGDLKAIEAEQRSEKRKKRENNYREFLRPIHRQLYDLFKFSYDYKFNVPHNYTDIIRKTLPIFYRTFDFHISPDHLTALESVLTGKEFELLKTTIQKSRKEFDQVDVSTHLPVNWCTLLGLRALTILKNSDNFKSLSQNNTQVVQVSNSNCERTFRERFKRMFYQTALLTRLQPQNTLKVKSFASCSKMSDDSSTAFGKCAKRRKT